jgi:ribokinase
LGGHVQFVAKVGNDIFGKQTIDGLKSENICTEYVLVEKECPSGVALIMVNEEGENCIVVAPGANAQLLPADISRIKNLDEAEIILMQLETPLDTIQTVTKMARASQQKVIINPAPAQELAAEVLDGLFLITPNETEACLLTGITVTDDASASQAADVFLAKGVQNVVITLGKNGAFFQNSAYKIKVCAPVVNAKDTTAAGDTFNGALALAITENMDWEEALNFAVQAASISVTRMGAQSSIPFRTELSLQMH